MLCLWVRLALALFLVLIYFLREDLRYLAEGFQIVHVDDEVVSNSDVLWLVHELKDQGSLLVGVYFDLLIVELRRALASRRA